MNASLSTGTSEYISLIGNGKSYRIPIYQRDYNWTEEQWDDLWFDILDLPIEKKHYLGYIVLQEISDDKREYWIIDGQQRFTTLTLFALATTYLLKKWAEEGIDSETNNKRALDIHNLYIGKYSASLQATSSKLFLNKNNNDFFHSYILLQRKPSNVARLSPSQQLLYKGYLYFINKLENHFQSKDGIALTRFLEEEVFPNLIFTTITVTDDLNAYKVFETLNARGVKLSPSDLLKNYIFQQISKLGEYDIEEAERKWQKINSTLGKIDFPTYLRHFWNSRNLKARSSNLFKVIREFIGKDEKKASLLLKDLEENVGIYVALQNPEDDLWHPKEREYLRLLKIFGSKQTLSLLLISFNKIDRIEFENLLHELMVIVFRYNKISGLNPNDIEDEVNKAALGVNNSSYSAAKQIVEGMKNIYLNDENFKNNFSLVQFNSKQSRQLVKYILTSIENQLSNSEYDYSDESITIEHILPENPGTFWYEKFNADEINDFIYRIGNLTLLKKSVNQSVQLNNEVSFELKKKYYDDSQFILTKEKLNFDDWSSASIKSRQLSLAKIACGIWKSKYII
ncbi:MAG: hypothetical protein RIQ33_2380 [Bacteroidota bacterium]